MSDPWEKKRKELEAFLAGMGLNDTQRKEKEKEMKDFQFWKTQPVTKLNEEIDYEGPIDKPKKPEDISSKPLPLLADFEWVTIDLTDEEEMRSVYELLHENYVEDQDATFRFSYNTEFFEWALMSPGWKKDWHVGVRVKSTGRLVAFISAIPVDLTIRSKSIKSVEINFLCIHKKLRAKRLAPLLIKEITRRVNRQDIWHALYTAGVHLPSPVSTCRYNHRPLNWSKLHDVDFSYLPEGATKAQMVSKYSLPLETITPGLRKLKLDDIDQVYDLFNRFQKRFELIQTFTREELTHWLVGGDKIIQSGEESKIIKTYVVEDKDGKITDFFSFYLLPFTVLGNKDHTELGVAYLFYYASEVSIDEDRFDGEATENLKKRLKMLVNDALILSKKLDVDVFNALTSQENNLFLGDCKFGSGNGFLNFYLFNYKSFPISGGISKESSKWDVQNRSGIGAVLF